MNARVQIVIAVHNVERPIERAVASALAASSTGESNVIVVAHGLDPVLVEKKLSAFDPSRVTVLPFTDGIQSPSGPFNYGLSHASAEFVGLLGSDDELEPGSIDAALARADRDGADMVIFAIAHAGGEAIATPLARPWRKSHLHPVKDRLFSRSAPLGIIRRHYVTTLAPVFDPQFVTGEDLSFSARLFATASISYARNAPGYLIHDDANDRVTAAAVLDLSVAFAAVRALADEPWFLATSERNRRALAAKIMRVQVLGAVTKRLEDNRALTPDELTALRETTSTWREVSPAALDDFPRRDRAVIAVLESCDETALREATARMKNSPLIDRLVPLKPWRLFARESVLRRYVIYFAHQMTPRRAS